MTFSVFITDVLWKEAEKKEAFRRQIQEPPRVRIKEGMYILPESRVMSHLAIPSITRTGIYTMPAQQECIVSMDCDC